MTLKMELHASVLLNCSHILKNENAWGNDGETDESRGGRERRGLVVTER